MDLMDTRDKYLAITKYLSIFFFISIKKKDGSNG